jgi:hypothetical protein
MFANNEFLNSDYAVDSTYVYLAFYPRSFEHDYYAQNPGAMKGPHDLGFLSRARRDGSSGVEVLGPGPSAFFIVSDGFAYWASPLEGIKRHAVVPGGTNEMVWASSDNPSPMFVEGGRLFFATARQGAARSFAVASVPVGTLNASAADAGGVDVRTHVASCQFKFGRGYGRPVFDGKCIYPGSFLGVSRVDLDDAKEEELISGPRNDVPASARSFVATDSQYLYWADYTRNRIIRWAR